MFFRWFAVLAAIVLVTGPGPASAAKLTSLGIQETATVPAVKPRWPVPAEPNQLFYLQRSTNSNTVVYTALFDEAGNLRADKPAQVYWRRYNTDGARKALKPVERRFAYGVNIRNGKAPGTYRVTLKPLPELPMTLIQIAPGRAELRATLGGRVVRPVYAHVSVDETGLIPRVTGLLISGIDVATGRAVTETFSVSGGAISQ